MSNDNPLKHGIKTYPFVNFFLFKGDEKKVIEFLREDYCSDRNGHIENTVNKGSYMAVLKIKWQSSEESNSGLTLSTYSDKRIEIKKNITDLI